MQCASCSFDNPPGLKFCGNCGQRFPGGCPACGFENPAGFRFCGECGAALAAEAPTADAPREGTERSPLDYTPQHLADRILQSKSALEGERKQVTVLFADVKGSMELAEQVDPERWHSILERFFEILTDGVHRFEGTVNQYTGDGIMALFGAPIAHENHAQRACYAALRLRDDLKGYSDELRLSEGLDFAVRMGINSGEVVVGKIGDDLRMDYTAQGHTVGLAARLEGVAPPNGVCVSETTAELVSGFVSLRDLGSSKIKGASEAIRVFELEGMGQIHSRFDMSRARGLTRFVGRDDDMSVLGQALEQARTGNGQVVGIVAQAGTGKSRLCFEFLERCRAAGLVVLQGTAVAHGKNIPFLPILQIFRQYFGISEQDGDRTAREKIAGRLLLIDESFREFLPVVFDFLAVPDPERPAPAIDPTARQRQLFSVMRKVIRAGEGATVNLIEDLHWIDAGSEEWLEQMVDAAQGSNTLVVVNFRPEYHAEWMQKSWYRQLPLLPLGPEAIRELLADLIGSDSSTARLAEAVHERTAGNPFFAEEIVQSLIESGSLEGVRGAYRLVTAVEQLQVPSNVQSVLAARIDRLGEREKQVLQAASVIGKQFAEPILAAVLDWPATDLREALHSLKGGEFIHEESLYPVTEFAFKHPLTQEVALGSQLRERRATTHAAVARAFEKGYPERLDENAALLAHHSEEAGELMSAARWHQRAADWLFASNAEQGLGHLRRVCELARALPEEREAQSLSVRAIPKLLINAWRIGLAEDEWEQLAREGRELSEGLGDTRLLLELERGLTMVRMLCGYVSDAVEPSRRAVELAEELGDLASRALAADAANEILWFQGRCPEALRAFEAEEKMLRDQPRFGYDIQRFSLGNWSVARQGYVLGMMGRCEEALLRYDRALRFAREHQEFDSLSLLSGFQAEHAWYRGIAEDGFAQAQQGLEISERAGNPASRMLAQSGLGLAHLSKGELEEARRVLAGVVEISTKQRLLNQYRAFPLASLAEAHLRLGDLSRAAALGGKATEHARRAGTKGYGLRAELVVAAIRIAQSELADAEGHIAHCDALLEATGAGAFLPMITEMRARLAAARGNDPTELLREAAQQFEAVGATGHLKRLSAELVRS